MYDKNKIIELLNSSDVSLFHKADEIRKEYTGNDVYLRGLIEFSNVCQRTCKYCGINCYNKHINRYRLDTDEIIKCAEYSVRSGLKTIVLQSGEDGYYTQDKMCTIIERIKKHNIAITLSIGEKSYKEYKAYKDVGADRYLLRIETTDKKLYKDLHPNMSYDKRLECLYFLKDIGYEIGTGSLVGLPNQSIESLADDILFFKEIDADMIGVGPFIPHKNTQLGNISVDLEKNFENSLKVMAITRILMKNINIPATSAMETIIPNGRIIALKSGANVVMPNMTSDLYKKQYEIYPNKTGYDKTKDASLNEIKQDILSIGRNISLLKGYRADNKKADV